MELTGYFLLFCGIVVGIWLFRERRGSVRESEFEYGNRLDQMREDEKVRKLIEESAVEAVRLYKSGSANYMRVWNTIFVDYKYCIFDSYTAKFKNTSINRLVYNRFNELTKENEGK